MPARELPSNVLPIDRKGLAAAVTGKLRDMIVEGVLAPGTRLNERILCEQLHVSRTPLREAFKTLAGEGLIEIMPNRGAMVVQLSASDIQQAFELIGALEGLAGRLACERITPEQVAELKALHFEMLAAHARRDLPGYYRLNHLIHDGIIAATGNARLKTVYQQLNASIQSLRFRSNFSQKKWDSAVQEHSAMVNALERRDGTALSEILQKHLSAKCDAVLADLRASQSEKIQEK